jgi:hypothetical protein
MKPFILILAIIMLPIIGSSQIVVSEPVIEAQQAQKNLFDQIKYAWEQTQWADKLATLHDTLSTVQEHLQTANEIKQFIGDPIAAIQVIDNGTFSSYLNDSGIADTLTELKNITAQGVALSNTISEMFEPIDVEGWKTNVDVSFEGRASFRDTYDPLKSFRAVENAYTQFQSVLTQAQAKRKTLNSEISRLNTQLKNAQDDAEVQKLNGSLQTAQSALEDLDALVDTSHHQVGLLQVLNQNREQAEETAEDEISRERNRATARAAAEAESTIPNMMSPDI